MFLSLFVRHTSAINENILTSASPAAIALVNPICYIFIAALVWLPRVIAAGLALVGMCICIYTYIYIYVYAYIHTCVYILKYHMIYISSCAGLAAKNDRRRAICSYTYISIYIYAYIHICVHILKYHKLYIHSCAGLAAKSDRRRARAGENVYMYLYIYIHIYICIHTCMCIYIKVSYDMYF